MDKANGMRETVSRRLSNVKVVVDLLNHELDLGKAERAVSLERDRLEAMLNSLELFIEDCEATLRSGGENHKKTEGARGTATRLN